MISGTLALASVSSSSRARARASEAGDLTRRGMAKFAGYDVEGSVRDFDDAIEVDSRVGAYLWHRGVSLYYAEDFDVAMNPNDTEESV